MTRHATTSRAGLIGLTALIALAPVVLTGCGDDESDSRSATLEVLAASSLTGTFTVLAATFEAEHPRVRVRLTFGSSAALAQQVSEGAPADVLATADPATMATAGLAEDDLVVFASNTMVLAVPEANPASITSLTDLDDADVAYLTCVDSAPCGAIAEQLIASAGLRTTPVSQEADVKAVLAKVVAGEADAGFVYATDVRATDAVLGIDIPGAEEMPTSYPIGVAPETSEPVLAADWVALVTGDRGRRVLAAAGFGDPR